MAKVTGYNVDISCDVLWLLCKAYGRNTSGELTHNHGVDIEHIKKTTMFMWRVLNKLEEDGYQQDNPWKESNNE